MRYNYFVPSEFQKFVEKCFRVMKSGEPGIVLFGPKTDRMRRIGQMIQDYKAPFPLIQINLIPGESVEIEDIHFAINSKFGKKPTKDIGICINNAEMMVEEKNYALIETILRLQLENPIYHFLLFFEKDITNPELSKWFSGTTIFTNIIYYPLYEYEDTKSFVYYNLIDEWKFELKDSVKEKIIKQCGGHFWFIRQALRALRDEPEMSLSDVFETEQMRFRVHQIYQSFLPSELRVLQAVIKSQKAEGHEESHAYSYLQKMRFIKDDVITIPLLTQYMKENMPKVSMIVTDKHILLNNINVENHFSKKEKRLVKLLLSQRDHIVARDEIAKALWPINTEDNYSDWAVDRIIARLRAKLIRLGLSKESIKTYRNRGYMLVN